MPVATTPCRVDVPLAAGKQFAETLPRMGDEDDSGGRTGATARCLLSFLPGRERLPPSRSRPPPSQDSRREISQANHQDDGGRTPLGSACIHRDAFVVPLNESGDTRSCR